MVAPFSGLRVQVETLLGEEETLREQVEALAVGLEAAAQAEHLAADQLVAPAVAPAGLELIERVREALHLSAAYLAEQQDDQVARQLAAELALLQGALPDPAGPPQNLHSCSRRE